MNLSVTEINPATHDVWLLTVAGFAADDVASVGVRMANGAVALRVPVFRNTYSAPAPPAGLIDSLVGFNAAGDAVYSKRMR
jgi:hypothetical protein